MNMPLGQGLAGKLRLHAIALAVMLWPLPGLRQVVGRAPLTPGRRSWVGRSGLGHKQRAVAWHQGWDREVAARCLGGRHEGQHCPDWFPSVLGALSQGIRVGPPKPLAEEGA